MSQPQKKTNKRSIKENMMPQQNPMVSQEPSMDMPMMQQEPSWDHPGCDDKVGKILLEYHWPQGRLEAIVERFTELGFNYKFEDGNGYEDGNGTVFFYRG